MTIVWLPDMPEICSVKYLRSNPDDKRTDNLEHLIDFDWIAPYWIPDQVWNDRACF
ncbi:hypothetical protein [Aquimarina muelleri]|uniref:hypothetical protein n=1 Tax=Aquimarina muelleri TaxID=279356 RepID=UPI0016727943|nr:hypothetical protein [Aquimarina muelleri]MCX2764331.1 DUF3892 domain-containing protein [Aquimarina muelleri]